MLKHCFLRYQNLEGSPEGPARSIEEKLKNLELRGSTKKNLELARNDLEPKVKIEFETATISLGDKQLVLYRNRTGGIKYRDHSGLHNFDFIDKNDFVKNLGEKFPWIKEQTLREIYEKLDLRGSKGVEYINLTADSSKIIFSGRQEFFLKKLSKGIEYRFGENAQAEIISFKNLPDLRTKLGEIFDQKIGKDRPMSATQIREMYSDLNLDAAAEIDPHHSPIRRSEIFSSTKEADLSFDEADQKATITFAAHQLTIKKLAKGIEYNLDNSSSKILYFENRSDFPIVLGKTLDHEIGRNRPNLREISLKIFDALKLHEATGRPQEQAQVEKYEQPEEEIADETVVEKTFFDPDFGVYSLNPKNPKPPVTYLLVKNANRPAYYCLSFTQSTFDMIHGIGAARRLGMFNKPYAELLDFTETPATVENYDPQLHQSLPRGAIVRFFKDISMSHIGISLGNGKIAHLIGDNLYIDKLTPDEINGDHVSEDWRPQEVIFPDETFEKKELSSIKTIEYREIFKKGTSLEEISPIFAKLRNNLKESWNSMEEIIYQLNKDKFRIKKSGRNVRAELKTDSSLKIPKEWLDITSANK